MIDPRQNMDYERGSSRCLGVVVVLAAVLLAAVLVIATGCATPPQRL